jgi:hypothetical protein
MLLLGMNPLLIPNSLHSTVPGTSLTVPALGEPCIGVLLLALPLGGAPDPLPPSYLSLSPLLMSPMQELLLGLLLGGPTVPLPPSYLSLSPLLMSPMQELLLGLPLSVWPHCPSTPFIPLFNPAPDEPYAGAPPWSPP